MDIERIKDYLHVDSEDDDTMLRMMMAAAESYIVGAVGSYDSTNEKANMLYLAIVQDLYENRVLTVTEQQRKRMSYTFASIILQLQMEQEQEETAG